MECHFTYAFIGLQALIWGGVLLILIYLIFRRIRIKKTETFDDRDN